MEMGWGVFNGLIISTTCVLCVVQRLPRRHLDAPINSKELVVRLQWPPNQGTRESCGAMERVGPERGPLVSLKGGRCSAS